jgi:hypothetical protein
MSPNMSDQELESILSGLVKKKEKKIPLNDFIGQNLNKNPEIKRIMNNLIIQMVKLVFHDVHSHKEVHTSLDQYSFIIIQDVSKSEYELRLINIDRLKKAGAILKNRN